MQQSMVTIDIANKLFVCMIQEMGAIPECSHIRDHHKRADCCLRAAEGYFFCTISVPMVSQ